MCWVTKMEEPEAMRKMVMVTAGKEEDKQGIEDRESKNYRESKEEILQGKEDLNWLATG